MSLVERGNDMLSIYDWARDTDVQFVGNGGTDVYRIYAPTNSPVAIEQSANASFLTNASTGVQYGSFAFYFSTERVEYYGTQFTTRSPIAISLRRHALFSMAKHRDKRSANDVVRINQ